MNATWYFRQSAMVVVIAIIECSGCSYPIQKPVTRAEVGELKHPKIVAATKRDGSEVRFDTVSEDLGEWNQPPSRSHVGREVATASLEGDTLVAHVKGQVTRIPMDDVEAIWIEETYHDKMWTYFWIGTSAVLVSLAVWYTLAFAPGN